MKDQPLEAEYRFDRVPKPERENCLNWELHREICRGYGQEIPQPWLEMTEKEKGGFREHCLIDLLYKQEPVSLVPLAFGTEIKSSDGINVSSAEVVTLPSLLVNWDCSDPQIIESFTRHFTVWLKEQRRTNPNARCFVGKSDIGPRKNTLTILLKLAVWRLHRKYQLTAPQIETKLAELFGMREISRTDSSDELERVSSDLAKGIQVGCLNRNLARWCVDIDTILRKKSS